MFAGAGAVNCYNKNKWEYHPQINECEDGRRKQERKMEGKA
jgi:hypothetical protein